MEEEYLLPSVKYPKKYDELKSTESTSAVSNNVESKCEKSSNKSDVVAYNGDIVSNNVSKEDNLFVDSKGAKCANKSDMVANNGDTVCLESDKETNNGGRITSECDTLSISSDSFTTVSSLPTTISDSFTDTLSSSIDTFGTISTHSSDNFMSVTGSNVSVSLDEIIKETEKKRKSKKVVEGTATKRLCGALWCLSKYTEDWDELIFGKNEENLSLFQKNPKWMDKVSPVKVRIFKYRSKAISTNDNKLETFAGSRLDRYGKNRKIKTFSRIKNGWPKYEMDIPASIYEVVRKYNHQHLLCGQEEVNLEKEYHDHEILLSCHGKYSTTRDFIKQYFEACFLKVFQCWSERSQFESEKKSEIIMSCGDGFVCNEDISSRHMEDEIGQNNEMLGIMALTKVENRKIVVSFVNTNNLSNGITDTDCCETMSIEIDEDLALLILNTVIPSMFRKSGQKKVIFDNRSVCGAVKFDKSFFNTGAKSMICGRREKTSTSLLFSDFDKESFKMDAEILNPNFLKISDANARNAGQSRNLNKKFEFELKKERKKFLRVMEELGYNVSDEEYSKNDVPYPRDVKVFWETDKNQRFNGHLYERFQFEQKKEKKKLKSNGTDSRDGFYHSAKSMEESEIEKEGNGIDICFCKNTKAGVYRKSTGKITDEATISIVDDRSYLDCVDEDNVKCLHDRNLKKFIGDGIKGESMQSDGKNTEGTLDCSNAQNKFEEMKVKGEIEPCGGDSNKNPSLLVQNKMEKNKKKKIFNLKAFVNKDKSSCKSVEKYPDEAESISIQPSEKKSKGGKKWYRRWSSWLNPLAKTKIKPN